MSAFQRNSMNGADIDVGKFRAAAPWYRGLKHGNITPLWDQLPCLYRVTYIHYGPADFENVRYAQIITVF